MSAKSKTKLKIIGVICLVLFAIELLIDPISYVTNVIRIAQIRRELPAAKARWQAQGITNYTVNVRGGVPLKCIALDAALVVEQGQLTRVLIRQNPFDHASPFVNSVDAEAWGGCAYGELLAPAMFERIEQILQTINPATDELIVSFDETSGIVTRFTLNTSYGIGLLRPAIGDCCMGYEFRDFQPMARGAQ